MNREDVLASVKNIIANNFMTQGQYVDKLELDVSILKQDIETFDDLDVVEMVMEFEEELDVTISDDPNNSHHLNDEEDWTINEMVDYIHKELGSE